MLIKDLLTVLLDVQVRYVGEREVPERMSTKHLRTEERVVEEAVTSPCSPLECNGCVPTRRGDAGNGVSILPNVLFHLPDEWCLSAFAGESLLVVRCMFTPLVL